MKAQVTKQKNSTNPHAIKSHIA